MTNAGLIIFVLFCHFIADFVMQSHEMAMKKSKSFLWLSYHILIYSLGILFFGIFIEFFSDPKLFIYWWVINVLSHYIIDFFISKLTFYLWKKQENHWFFVTIGFDQLLHTIILIYTTFYFIL